MVMTLKSRKKRLSFLSLALGSFIATVLATGPTGASWSSPRCAAQCSKAFFASKNMVNAKVLRKEKEKVINDYKNLLNDCAVNCDNTKIMDLFFPDNYEHLDPTNQQNLQNILKNQQSRKQKDQADIQSKLKEEMAKPNPINSTIKTLQKNQDKLISEINKLGSQLHKVEGALKTPGDKALPLSPSKEASNVLPHPVVAIPGSTPSVEESIKIAEEAIAKAQPSSADLPSSQRRPKLELEEDVLKKIAHPEGQKFIEPEIPEIEGFIKDTATLKPDKTTLTKWGIVRILQAAGIIAKRDPNETKMIEVPDIKNPKQMTKVIKPLDKNDVDKIITNNPEPKPGGSYSEAIYFINVNPHYLAKGHTQTHYVLKKNKWAFKKVDSRDQNTPVKELIDLQKVQAYIIPKLSKSEHAKISAIGNSAFYLDEKGEKLYFVVLDTADGQPVIELFNKFANTDQKKWHNIMFSAGKALGELHWLLSDQEQFKKININDLKLSDIKTIPHGDLHLNNIFYDDKNNSVTFIDTGSMADSVREKKSPEAEFSYFFGITKYLHTLGRYDFNKLNEDFASFADGYAQGFSKNKELQEKIKNILVDYFKVISTEYGASIYLKMLKPVEYNQHVPPLVKSLIEIQTTPNAGQMPGDLIVMVFSDNYVSKNIKKVLTPTLLHHKLVTQEKVDSELAGG